MLGTSLLWRSTVAFTYLNVKSAKCLVYFRWSRSCLHHYKLQYNTTIQYSFNKSWQNAVSTQCKNDKTYKIFQWNNVLDRHSIVIVNSSMVRSQSIKTWKNAGHVCVCSCMPVAVLRAVLREIRPTSDPAVHRPVLDVQHIYAAVGDWYLWLLYPRSLGARQRWHRAETDVWEHCTRTGLHVTLPFID